MNPDNLISLFAVIFLFVICAIVFFIIRGIWRTFKRFIFELIDHIKGTPGRSSGQNYHDEARKACEKVTPKRKQNTTPPWEE